MIMTERKEERKAQMIAQRQMHKQVYRHQQRKEYQSNVDALRSKATTGFSRVRDYHGTLK